LAPNSPSNSAQNSAKAAETSAPSCRASSETGPSGQRASGAEEVARKFKRAARVVWKRQTGPIESVQHVAELRAGRFRVAGGQTNELGPLPQAHSLSFRLVSRTILFLSFSLAEKSPQKRAPFSAPLQLGAHLATLFTLVGIAFRACCCCCNC